MCQTLKSAFDHSTKHLKVCQKYYTLRHILNSFPGVWKCCKTQSFVFDLLLEFPGSRGLSRRGPVVRDLC